MTTGSSKMGKMSKLSQFSGIKAQSNSEESPPVTPEPIAEPLATDGQAPKVLSHPQPASTKEKLVTVNIKITRFQHEWLSDTAQTVRDNNLEPVPASERVFPQHLIGVAIDLLQNSGVDWSQVKNAEDLKRQLSR